MIDAALEGEVLMQRKPLGSMATVLLKRMDNTVLARNSAGKNAQREGRA